MPIMRHGSRLAPTPDKAAASAPQVNAPRAEKAKPVTYQSGKKRVKVVLDQSLYAIGLLAGAAAAEVAECLGGLARVQPMASQGMALVRPEPGVDPAKVEAVLAALGKDGLIAYYTPMLRDELTGRTQIPNDEITVRFKRALQIGSVNKLMARHGVKVERQNEFVPQQYVVKLPNSSGLDTLRTASGIDAENEVAFAVPNFVSEHTKEA